MDDVNHYEVLGVSVTASPAELRAAHRAAVKRHHPDLHGDEEKFRAVQRAWEVLGSPDAKALYDAERSLAQRRTTPYPPPHPGPTSHTGPSRSARPRSAGSTQPETGDPIAARARHALGLRAELGELWDELGRSDDYVEQLRVAWRKNLSPADRAEVQRRHTDALEEASGWFTRAYQLAALLGIPDEAWPPFPNLQGLTGPTDELGWEVSDRVWFSEPWDLLTGPLWMTPQWRLRVRTAAWMAVVAVLFWAARRSEVAGLWESPPQAASTVEGWVSRVAFLPFVAGAAAIGAVAWPSLLAVGMFRRTLAEVPSRWVRYGTTGAALGAATVGEWWATPAVGAAWVAIGALVGLVGAAARPTLAGLWARWWTAGVGARLARKRPKRRVRTGRRTRRRTKLGG